MGLYEYSCCKSVGNHVSIKAENDRDGLLENFDLIPFQIVRQFSSLKGNRKYTLVPGSLLELAELLYMIIQCSYCNYPELFPNKYQKFKANTFNKLSTKQRIKQKQTIINKSLGVCYVCMLRHFIGFYGL